jgi:Flp pilus assembly protein TadD
MDSALRALVDARTNDPYHAETRYLLGTLLARLGRSEEAETELAAFRDLKLFEERKSHLEIAILARPEDADAYRALIELYLESGRNAEALPYVEKALALAPGDPELLALSTRARESSRR